MRLTRNNMIKIATVFVSILLLSSIRIPVFALVEGPAEIITQTPRGEIENTQLLPLIQGYTLDFVYRDTDFEKTAGQDASLLYVYQPIDETKETVWVSIEIGPLSSLHRWETCVIDYPIRLGDSPMATQLEQKDIQIQENPPIIGKYFAFQWTKTKETQVVFYWYETAQFKTNSTTSEQKQIKTSVITYPYSPQDLTKSEDLQLFANSIVNYWEPMLTLSKTTLLLSQNGMNFATITSIFTICLIFYYAFETNKYKNMNSKTYNKLSKPNKQLINTVYETQKNTTPNFRNISNTYKKRYGESIEREELLKRLTEMEKIGLIRRDTSNVQDEPTCTWKTQLFLNNSKVRGNN